MPDPSGYSTDRVLAALLLALDEGVLVFDDQGVCRAANRRAAEIFGLDAAAVVGLARADLLARAAAVAAAPDALAPLALSGERTVVDPIALMRPSPRTVVWTSVPAGDRGRLDLIRDVTASGEAAAEAARARRSARARPTTADASRPKSSAARRPAARQTP